MSDSQSKLDDFLEELAAFGDRLKAIYEELGLGKDELLRAHSALDTAAAAVKAHGPLAGHDLNDDLAEKPEDHPAVQGQPEHQEIQMGDPAPPEPVVAPVVVDPTPAPAPEPDPAPVVDAPDKQ